MRLIDADAIIEKQRENMESMYVKTIPELKKHMSIDDSLSVYIHCMEGYARAKQFYHGLRGILENAPTVDAVPIMLNDKGYTVFECYRQNQLLIGGQE